MAPAKWSNVADGEKKEAHSTTPGIFSNKAKKFGPDVFPASGRNEPLVVKKIKDGGQQIGVEICLFALGKERIQQEVLAGHETH